MTPGVEARFPLVTELPHICRQAPITERKLGEECPRCVASDQRAKDLAAFAALLRGDIRAFEVLAEMLEDAAQMVRPRSP